VSLERRLVVHAVARHRHDLAEGVANSVQGAAGASLRYRR